MFISDAVCNMPALDMVVVEGLEIVMLVPV